MLTIDNLQDIVAGSRCYNLHGHTEFCDGRMPMADFARRAVELGFATYGFTPHSPVPFASSCNMSEADVPRYFAEVQRLRGLYAGRCRFLAGMEIDYISPQWGPSSEYFASLPLDYAIGSVHFIPDKSGRYVDIDGRFESFRTKMEQDFGGDIDYVVNTYFDQMEAMVRAGGFQIVGHMDKIAQNASYFCPGLEDSQMYLDRIDRLISLIISSGLIVEVNTKARVDHRRIFPAERHLPRLVAAGVPLVVNSDAHYVAKIDASRAYAFELLDALSALCRK